VAEGEETRGTVIFGKDPRRQIEVIWWDEKNRTRPSMIRIKGVGWTGPRGIKVGASLADVEASNGRPFTLSGFSWDFGGYVTNLKDGALASIPGGCRFGIRFDPDPKASEARLSKVIGDREFSSSLPAMKAVAPRVSEISLGYPE
jgi:hypothetical protein